MNDGGPSLNKYMTAEEVYAAWSRERERQTAALVAAEQLVRELREEVAWLHKQKPISAAAGSLIRRADAMLAERSKP